MSQEQKLTGFIVKTQDLGEADLLLTFFTLEEGKLRFLAKSAKRITSKLAGRLQPYYEIDLTTVGNGGLPKLIGAEVVSDFSALLDNHIKVQALSVIQELILRSLPDQQPNLSLYELYKKSISSLVLQGEDKAVHVIANFFVQSLKALGFSPETISTETSTGTQTFFAMDTGKFISQQNSLNDRPVHTRTYNLYKELLASGLTGELSSFEQQPCLDLLEILSTFAEYQLERDLKSVRYFLGSVLQ